ncbi:hypothetical protein AALB64_06830 [Lachnospiraceae bacterium 45-P1]
MKIKKGLSQLPENAVFWLLLLSLAAGSAASLYGKISDRAALEEAGAEHYTAAPASAGRSVISIKDYLSSDLPYPCQIYKIPAGIR